MTITTNLSGRRADPPTVDHPTNPADTAVAADGESLTDALAALSDSTKVTISTEQVSLLSVTGRLDDTGLAQLRRQLQALLDTTTQYLVVNLAGVTGCDYRLFEVLARTHQILTDRQGWIRLVGVGPAVRNALDEATLSEFHLVCQASDWTSGLVRP